MTPTTSKPSLIVFGPQKELSSRDAIDQLRREINQNPQLSHVLNAAKHGAELWKPLANFDPTLNHIPGAKLLAELQEWVVGDGPLPSYNFNTFRLPVTVLLEIAQYFHYLRELNVVSPHRLLLGGVKTCGVLGICVGFLSAIAVATSEIEAEIAFTAAAVFRLAVIIASLSDIPRLTEKLRANGSHVTTVSVEGAFHSDIYTAAVERIKKFAVDRPDLHLPSVNKLQAPLRSTVDGEIITSGSLLQHALENVLLKPAAWFKTVQGAVFQLKGSKTVAFAGFGNHIPASLVSGAGLYVLDLNKLTVSNLDGFPNGTRIKGTNKPGNGVSDAQDSVPYEYPPNSIAIVGVSGRFPGADSLDELWELLLSGKSIAEPAPVKRLQLPTTGEYANKKWWGNFLRDPDAFDHKFFKKSQRTGGQLAMSLAWTAPQRGLRPPEAILAFYCPTNYEDDWWRNPIQPIGAEDWGDKYDLLKAIQDEPITNYGVVGAWEPLSDPRIRTDLRCRIVLHINWKAQTLPIIIGGLPSKKNSAGVNIRDWNTLPQPSLDEIVRVSPRAQILRGNYHTPTFLIHGTNDDLIPWQQSQGTYDALQEAGVTTGLALIEGAPHICDFSSNPESEGWKAAIQGYEFISNYV
ncbi:uncharacterized protein N7479_009044 [Penicillium vulpinum]|uniref:uncharacterized protein n=1 Tax=Penicillium vulpinum TaxID=29845 RepID=UPI0025480441|nr:uncharacterized protein N7479_009044 [Penicillium vulpinum]KAJ5950631.1 hypothetical protein N7479_009044 [Penicillium vulpinum]